jgi:predicted N-acetyltransferase YhbS
VKKNLKNKDMNNFYIEKIQTCEITGIANILTEAFETNPAYSSIFNRSDLREGLIWLFKTNLFLLNRRQVLTRVIKEKKSGRITGTFTLIPPKGAKITIGDYLRTGLPAFICRFGISSLYRMLDMDHYNKKILTESIQSGEYYYLSMVAVKETYRRAGIGSFAIKSCLDELHKAKRNCHLVGLTTQLPENVFFYSRLGFEIIDEGEVHFKKNHYYNCNMKYVIS